MNLFDFINTQILELEKAEVQQVPNRAAKRLHDSVRQDAQKLTNQTNFSKIILEPTVYELLISEKSRFSKILKFKKF